MLSRSYLVLAVLLAACGNAPEPTLTAPPPDLGPLGTENMAYRWGAIALEGTANDTEQQPPRPPVNSRLLALPFRAQFDAWSRFDSVGRARAFASGTTSRGGTDHRQ
ncbi:MAG: hypothetical protein IPI07_02465 [Flavobacteriales bacterium]|nr:hypothetical protein [Flavobacteriales bacterium]